MGNKSSLWPNVLDPDKRAQGQGSGRKYIPAFVRDLVKYTKLNISLISQLGLNRELATMVC
jgi:ATP-dependent protease HslVU (ClpYQ) peptidase subunit